MVLIACLYPGFTLPFITLFKFNGLQWTLCRPGGDFSLLTGVTASPLLLLDFCWSLLDLLFCATSWPNSCSWCQDYMKSPPRHKLNPVRGLLGTRDDFPPVTANWTAVRPRGRPLIILMYAGLTPASAAKDRMPPAEWHRGAELCAHVASTQPPPASSFFPPVPEGPFRISLTAF